MMSDDRTQTFRATHLEDGLPLSVVGGQRVSLAEFIISGHVVLTHDSATQRKSVVFVVNTDNTLQQALPFHLYNISDEP